MMPMPGGWNIRLWHAWLHLCYLVPLLVVADLGMQILLRVLMPWVIMELSVLIVNFALCLFYHLITSQLMLRSWKLTLPIIAIAFVSEQSASMLAFGIGLVEAPIVLRLIGNLLGRPI